MVNKENILRNADYERDCRTDSPEHFVSRRAYVYLLTFKMSPNKVNYSNQYLDIYYLWYKLDYS